MVDTFHVTNTHAKLLLNCDHGIELQSENNINMEGKYIQLKGVSSIGLKSENNINIDSELITIKSNLPVDI